MDSPQPQPRLTSDLPLAAASAGGFWAFYFLTIVVRTALIDQDWDWLFYRGIGCLIGLALTFLVWLVLSRAAQESVRVQVVAAAIACVPAAAIFSTFNLAFGVHQPLVARTVVTERSGQGTALQANAGQEAVPPPVPPPLAPAAVLAEVQRQRTIRLIADGLVTWYFFFAAWASFYIAMSSAARLRTAERRAARAERDAQAAQLRALRYQVNPHFLFNTLNSLSSLVMARREEEAEAMIVNLSTFFRSSLALDPGADVDLADEIEFQKLYLDIEKVRFPRRLEVRFDVPAELRGARVPPLLLQPLVENAIKHAVARTSEPVVLTIAAREEDSSLILSVENDRGPAPGAAPGAGTGVGLANVCERLAARFGGAADCEAGPLPGGGYRVTLTMPLESDG
ncbi:MAG: histidine kinase [Alphaproteobacteria bacterium]|nr:histidine kinase [Alphaproteobacteria bacterium]MBV9370347.1 histidine kinase [Alphaproteobacteria bacterium]MBV9901996.1 histidine kinase [Alphaproteobacteria bacterium]